MLRRKERLSAAGVTPWIPLSAKDPSFEVALAYIPSSDANLVAEVQHTFDDPNERILSGFLLTRSTTTATLNLPDHGLDVDDWLLFQGCGAPFDGVYHVGAVTDQDNVTFTVANSGRTSNLGTGVMSFARVFPHAALTTLSGTREDGNYDFPPMACRLIISSHTLGYADLIVLQAG